MTAPTWNWQPASGLHVKDIVLIAQDHFQFEIDQIFTPCAVTYSHNITLAVVNQFYGPNHVLLWAAITPEQRVLAYTWAIRGQRAEWSDNEMIVIRMAHVAMGLSARVRILMIRQMFDIWEDFARRCGVAIICSTTMRHSQSVFLRMHAQAGYDVRGSYAYKRLK